LIHYFKPRILQFFNSPLLTLLNAGAWALVVGHSSLLLAALLLPEAATFSSCAVHLAKKANQQTVANLVTKPCTKIGLLDGTGSPYWKVNN